MPRKHVALIATLFLAAAPLVYGQASTTFIYDNHGRVLTVEDTDIGIVSYEYDKAGNLTNRTVTSGGTQAPPTCPVSALETANSSSQIVYPLDVCSDPNGDTLEITSITVTTSNGTTATHTTTQVIFKNIPCPSDTFADFTVSDGNGGYATGQIELIRIGC